MTRKLVKIDSDDGDWFRAVRSPFNWFGVCSNVDSLVGGCLCWNVARFVNVNAWWWNRPRIFRFVVKGSMRWRKFANIRNGVRTEIEPKWLQNGKSRLRTDRTIIKGMLCAEAREPVSVSKCWLPHVVFPICCYATDYNGDEITVMFTKKPKHESQTPAR